MLFLLCAASLADGAVTNRSEVAQPEHGWQTLEPGLELGVFLAPVAAETGDSLIRVLRIDPQRFEFRLLNASAAESKQTLTAKAWCQQHGLVAAINASMYQQDYRTSVSLMRTKTHVNNPRLSGDKAILAFDRQTAAVPLLKIIDRQCENFEDWQASYGTFVQSIRLISCKGRNVWRPQDGKWSLAAIGLADDGWGLFIHVRSPYSTYDVIDMLLALPLRIAGAMYAEGGREAQLYVQSGQFEYEFVGGYNTSFIESNNTPAAAPIPNVIGIARREQPAE